MDGTQRLEALEGYTRRVYAAIDSMAIELGRVLTEVHELFPKAYEHWVETELPFKLDKARRLRMVYRMVTELPAEIQTQLPRPWQALYALSRAPSGALTSAVEAGIVHPGLSVAETNRVVAEMKGGTRHFTDVDLIVGKLVTRDVEHLGSVAREALLAWLHSSATGH